MATVIAIDPGTEQSASVVLVDGVPTDFGIFCNADLLRVLRSGAGQRVVIEQVASYGMPVGKEVFETVYWSGRFAEAVESRGGVVDRVTRNEVKMHLCHRTKGVNDSVIIQAMYDRFGPGRSKAVGTKKNPGPCYGIRADIWQALALGCVWFDTNGKRD